MHDRKLNSNVSLLVGFGISLLPFAFLACVNSKNSHSQDASGPGSNGAKQAVVVCSSTLLSEFDRAADGSLGTAVNLDQEVLPTGFFLYRRAVLKVSNNGMNGGAVARVMTEETPQQAQVLCHEGGVDMEVSSYGLTKIEKPAGRRERFTVRQYAISQRDGKVEMQNGNVSSQILQKAQSFRQFIENAGQGSVLLKLADGSGYALVLHGQKGELDVDLLTYFDFVGN